MTWKTEQKTVQVAAPFPEVVVDYIGEGLSVTLGIDRTGGGRTMWIRVRATTGDQHSSEFVDQDLEARLPEYCEVGDNDA